MTSQYAVNSCQKLAQCAYFLSRKDWPVHQWANKCFVFSISKCDWKIPIWKRGSPFLLSHVDFALNVFVSIYDE